MDIKFLGRWSSNLVPGERNVSILLDNKIAFDFGPHSLESVLERGLDPNKISMLLISHMHLDHYVGIAELLWYRSIYKAEGRLIVLGPKGIRRNTERLTRILRTPPAWYKEQIDVNTEYVEDRDTDYVKVIHANHSVPCNAYRVEYGSKTILYSGDTSYSKRVVDGARDVDWLFHEATYVDKDRKLADLWGHSTLSDAVRVFRESGAKHLVPVHLTESSNAVASKMPGKIDGLVYPVDTLTF